MIYKRVAFLLFLLPVAVGVKAQKVQQIFFHLYTDSLKKGTYNYINVDAKLSNGRWQPLTDKDLIFNSNYGSFKGNSLWIPDTSSIEKVQVSVLLKADTSIQQSTEIYIKILEDWGKVVSPDEVLPPQKQTRRKKNGF
ncbi:hypothetical protein [Gynurincola endophyticus]|uniref:hypothetical protein n=1 Tax=Gynurincola endophyticus TaxID=2479004 RepID=UPI000F8F33F2|nr:hypothetical protein [Gynurincola endophyticus]